MSEQSAPGADRLIEDVMGLWRLVHTASYPAHHDGITMQQFWLLRHLERRCPLSVGTLAEAIGITSSSATSACKRLEQLGLVTRTRQASDERVVLLELTKQGHTQLVEVRQRQRDALGRFLGVLDPQEQTTLQQLLDRVLAASGSFLDGQPGCPAGPHSRAREREGTGATGGVRSGSGWPQE